MVDEREIVVLAVTRAGARLAARIAAALPGTRIYVPERFGDAAPGAIPYHGPVAAVMAGLFPTCRALVLVLAAGAAVRLIAPHLRDKRTDPAVVAVDNGGRWAVALLSGHVGGANDLAHGVASAIGAAPVITTASEAHGTPAADLIGQSFGWRVENPEDLKALAAALVNEEPVGIVQEAGESGWWPATDAAKPRRDRADQRRCAREPLSPGLPSHVSRHASLEELIAVAPAAAIIITDRLLPTAARRRGWVVYRPRTLVAGIGCSRGAGEAEIAALVDEALTAGGLSALSLREVATIDLKAVEPELTAFAAARGLPVRLYSASELDAAPGQKHPSDIVRAAVGTRGVCEPAALLAAGAVRLLVPKHKSARATVAIARRKP